MSAQANIELPESVVTNQPVASPKPASRKVSIASDPVAESRYDNLAYEPCTNRKTSQVNKTIYSIVQWRLIFLYNFFIQKS